MNANPQARFVSALWARLPHGPLVGREALKVIMRHANLGAGDFATAEAILAMLVVSGAVKARAGSKPNEYVYERAAVLPDWPDNGPGSDLYNARLRLEHERELEEVERERQRRFEESPQALERRMWERFVDERLDRALGPLRDEIARLREQVGNTEVAA